MHDDPVLLAILCTLRSLSGHKAADVVAALLYKLNHIRPAVNGTHYKSGGRPQLSWQRSAPHAAQLALEAQLQCALKPSGPQQEESGTLSPALFLADQLQTSLRDLNFPLGSSSCTP